MLAENGNGGRFSLLKFWDAVPELPSMCFPRGEMWVLLWGGADIYGEHFAAGSLGAVGANAIYGPKNIEAGTIVLVYSPRAPLPPAATEA